jgi:glycosyltransferase involved in cell wall biosynthesis
MNRTKLALLHYTAPPVLGGVEAILGIQAQLLAASGHDVRVIAGEGDAEVVPEIWSRHPKVERVAHALAAGEPIPAEFERLQALLTERLRPLLNDRDLVIAHNVLTMPFNLPLAGALVAIGLPIVAWTHDLAWINPRYRQYQREGAPYDVLHCPQPNATYVAISQVRQKEIVATLGLPPSMVPVVPNGIDPMGFWGIGPRTRDLAKRGGFENANPLVLVPVRVTRRKRLELAVEAAAQLQERYPNLRVLVSGPLGPHDAANQAYASWLKDLRSSLGLETTVRFLYELGQPGGPHPVDDRSTTELYRMADCVLLPSESEGFGLPVLEAALSRAPMVAADIDVIKEVGGSDVYTFPTQGSASDVATAAERALQSRPARLRRRVIEHHDWRSVSSQLEDVIEEVIG